MSKRAYGFTIVELLIVIVVIAILAAVSIVAYTGIQTRAKNTARYNEVKQWQRLFEVYRAEHGTFPDISNGNYCLGSGFPSGSIGVSPRCRSYNNTTLGYLESGNVDLMNALSTIGVMPSGDRSPSGTLVGPWVTYTSSDIHFNFIFDGSSPSDCPSGTTSAYNSDQAVWCRYIISKN